VAPDVRTFYQLSIPSYSKRRRGIYEMGNILLGLEYFKFSQLLQCTKHIVTHDFLFLIRSHDIYYFPPGLRWHYKILIFFHSLKD
jgi:hypothetical protein